MSAEVVNRALARLARASLLTFSVDVDGASVSMHRLVMRGNPGGGLDDIRQPVVEVRAELPRFGQYRHATGRLGLLSDPALMDVVAGAAADVYPFATAGPWSRADTNSISPPRHLDDQFRQFPHADLGGRADVDRARLAAVRHGHGRFGSAAEAAVPTTL